MDTCSEPLGPAAPTRRGLSCPCPGIPPGPQGKAAPAGPQPDGSVTGRSYLAVSLRSRAPERLGHSGAWGWTLPGKASPCGLTALLGIPLLPVKDSRSVQRTHGRGAVGWNSQAGCWVPVAMPHRRAPSHSSSPWATSLGCFSGLSSRGPGPCVGLRRPFLCWVLLPSSLLSSWSWASSCTLLGGCPSSRPGSLDAFCCALPMRGSPGGAPLPVRGPCRPGSSCHPRHDWPGTH